MNPLYKSTPRRFATLLIIVVALFSGSLDTSSQTILNTRSTSLLLQVEKGSRPQFVYYGTRLHETDLPAALANAGKYFDAYPARLSNTAHPDALSVMMPDGGATTDLQTEIVQEGTWEGGHTLDIVCKDPRYPFFKVTLHYRSYTDEDIIEMWTDISNSGNNNIVLHRYDSAFLPIPEGNVWMSSLQGGWADECNVYEEPLTRGTREISEHNGVRNSATAHSEVMFSLDGKPQENEGRVIGTVLCYGGNFEMRVITRYDGYHRFFAGISPRDAWYTLSKREVFTTPKVAFTYSEDGLGGASRHFHRWGRKYMLCHGGQPGDILLNSWEGVYMNIQEDQMERMARDIAGLGGELFVIDDGWFGSTKYPRDHDKQGLGDWEVLPQKLPNGLQNMAERCRQAGVKFGIWIEPEMVNIQSELYEKHPDWVLNAPGRELVAGRGGTQMVLDLCNPAVQDYVVSIVDKLLRQAPDIAYIKWDCNNYMRSPGSLYLKNTNHLAIEYMRGLTRVLNRIRAAYPDVAMQLCAGGGARVNWGLLPWFDEFWTSDNTDALQRLRIQWGTSFFFPAEAMACHISATPNHQTGRIIPLKYRIDVAMTGRMGFELQPADISQEERDICRQAVSDYKTIRQTVQCGDLYRLVSPFDKKGIASLMYCSEDKKQAAFFWYRTEYYRGDHPAQVSLRGLNPDFLYKVTELNKVDGNPVSALDGKIVSGQFLMSNGFLFPEKESYQGGHNDWHSHVIRLDAVTSLEK